MQRRPNAVLQFIRSQLNEGNSGSISDAELLRRFATQHDENAFRIILRRHGPTVLRVCQRIVKRQEDAEDVFQATFLVLARKAGSYLWRDSVGSWLCEVAHRLAQETRRKHLRQEAREAHAHPKPAENPLAEITGHELVAILDEELANLPERYRSPLLLCCVEGKSGDEAAQSLGCSLRTLQRRLQHGRELLQRRLSRRGFSLSMTALVALLLSNKATAGVTAELLARTALAAALVAAGGPITAGLASAPALALAGTMTRAVVFTKLNIAVSVLLVAGGLTAGSFALARQMLVANAENTGRPSAKDPLPADGVLPLPVAGSSFAHRLGDPRKPMGPGPSGSALSPATSVVPARIGVVVETNLRSAPGQIRQFAFDGDTGSYFSSAQNAGKSDYFALVLDQPVALKSVAVSTGRPWGDHLLEKGVLEISADGRVFTELARFADGLAKADARGQRVKIIRVRPLADLKHPLSLREFTLESDPPLNVFAYPVEVAIDVSEAPEMKEWARNAARTCERAYPVINEALACDGYKPRYSIAVKLRNDSRAIASANGGGITASVKYFKENPEDMGALVETMVYVVQRYQDRSIPRWLVYGIADYVRFFKYEPGKLPPLDPDRHGYDGRPWETAAFMAYLTREYDSEFVPKLNQILRNGQYKEEVFRSLSGKSLQALGTEWLASQRPTKVEVAGPQTD
jgi:RNA polymerase sigma factor (sigma-70 family)